MAATIDPVMEDAIRPFVRPRLPHFESAIHVMETQGGSFVRALAECWYRADPANRAILRSSFAGYFDEYERQFEHWRALQVPIHPAETPA